MPTRGFIATLATLSAVVLTGCASRPPSALTGATVSATPPAVPAERVAATVEKVVEDGYVEILPEGGKRWSNLVVLAMDQPGPVPSPLRLHSATLRIGDRQVKVGDRLTFLKPSYTQGLALSDLEEVAFQN